MELKIKNVEQVHKAKCDPLFLSEIKKVRKDLDNLLTERVEQALAFTKQKYYDRGAKSLEILSYKQQKKSNIAFIKNNSTKR